jgi:nickel/cobalt transporter (NicO) family protein
MNQIILGSIALSVIHALIPSHWLPFVTIGKAQGWGLRQILRTTLLAGAAHTLSTTIFGLLASFAGFQLAENQHIISQRVVPLFLVVLGIWFIMQHLRGDEHKHIDEKIVKGKSYKQLVFSLVIMMFLSPCFEISAYFLSAGTIGWMAVATIIVIYNILTIAGMLIMVALANHGINRLNIHWLQHNEQLLTGLTLFCLAIFTFFIEL